MEMRQSDQRGRSSGMLCCRVSQSAVGWGRTGSAPGLWQQFAGHRRDEAFTVWDDVEREGRYEMLTFSSSPFWVISASSPDALSCHFFPFLCCSSLALPKCVAVIFLFLAGVLLLSCSFFSYVMEPVFICCRGIILIQFCFPSLTLKVS